MEKRYYPVCDSEVTSDVMYIDSKGNIIYICNCKECTDKWEKELNKTIKID